MKTENAAAQTIDIDAAKQRIEDAARGVRARSEATKCLESTKSRREELIAAVGKVGISEAVRRIESVVQETLVEKDHHDYILSVVRYTKKFFHMEGSFLSS